MNKKDALKTFNEFRKKIDAYSLVIATTYFDKETVAPRGGNKYRNDKISFMSGEAFSISTDPKYIESIEYLNKCDLPFEKKREIALYKKELDNIIKFTKEDVIEYGKAQMDSFDAWEKAKNTNNFSLWQPHLLKLIELSKKRAKIRNAKKDPYDLYLDDFEEDMTKEKYDKFFKLVKKELIPLIKEVNKRQDKIDDSFLYKYYPKEKQEKFMREVLLKYLGFNSSWGHMGVSEHPFTNYLSDNDIRITTSYNEHNISSCLFSVIHECGHAFYMHQIDHKYEGSVINYGVSSGMHESQSRFVENYLGRRKSFWKSLYPKLQNYFPENLGDVTLDDFIKAINVSRSSLIRVDADELTYPIHILIRYELEKGIFEGKVDLKHLNKEWNKKYKEYLGIDVPNDRNGILQDVHWPDGNFGYFPTYALGSAIGAQVLNKMEKSIKLDKCLENNEFNKVTKYLKDNLHKYGALYNYNNLLKKFTGSSFNPKYYINYLKKKYSKLYDIKVK